MRAFTNSREVTMASRGNEYLVTKRDMASPYYKQYCEARGAYTPAKDSFKRAPVIGSSYFEQEPEEVVNENQGKKVKKEKVKRQRTKGTMKRARRGFIVFLVMFFALLYVVVGALSFLQLDMLSDFNSYFALFTKVEEVYPEDATLEQIENGEVACEYITTPIYLDDVVMSFVAMLTGEEVETGTYYFYDECLAFIDGAETMDMIAFYALPVVLVLGLVVALIFFIRALITLCTPKRRKLFILSSVLMIVLTIVGIFAGFIWSGLEFADAMVFLNVMSIALPMQVGYGYLIMTVLSILALVMSLFAFRSKKKVQ